MSGVFMGLSTVGKHVMDSGLFLAREAVGMLPSVQRTQE